MFVMFFLANHHRKRVRRGVFSWLQSGITILNPFKNDDDDDPVQVRDTVPARLAIVSYYFPYQLIMMHYTLFLCANKQYIRQLS